MSRLVSIAPIWFFVNIIIRTFEPTWQLMEKIKNVRSLASLLQEGGGPSFYEQENRIKL